MPALELSALALQPQHLQKLKALLAQYTPEAQVWAYGSRVNGTAHEGSDLDLVLRNPADLAQEAFGGHALREALQASDLPILVDVHQWSQLPMAFHPNIEAAYVVVHPRG
jgi:predicted nucleotidyltransferase